MTSSLKLFLLLLLSISSSSSFSSSWVQFSNSTSSLVLTTPVYTLSLSATSGTLEYLLDTSSSETLFYGSGFGQLWAMVGPSGSLNNNALPFSWIWNQETNGGGELILLWKHTTGGGDYVRVNVTALANMRFFDLTFELISPPIGQGDTWNSLWFPSMPLFNGSNSKVFFPILPGITLNSSFFQENNPINIPYPGSGVFAEFLHVNASRSSVSLFTISGPLYTIPHMKSLYPAPASGQGLWRYAHSIQPINVTDGCDPLNGEWIGGDTRPSTSMNPCALGLLGTVRVRIAINGSAMNDLILYGISNGLINNTAGSEYPNSTLITPYGSQPFKPILIKVKGGNETFLRNLARSTLVKIDAIGLGLNFSEYKTQLLPALSPLGQGLLIHTCAWEPIAFDHFYPDLLPPNTRFGTGCELASAHEAMSIAGHLTMPYSNPTWWDPTAPTLSHLPSPLVLDDVSSLNSSYQSIYETYPDTPPATGIVSELAHPFVTARIRKLLCQLDDTLLWPDCSIYSTQLHNQHRYHHFEGVCNESLVRLHDDIIFEDQLGARNAYADFHPSQKGLGALGFQNAIEQHAFNVTSSVWGENGVLLATEQGYDRLAHSVIGFYGNAIELNSKGYPFFSGNWTLTPLSSVLFGTSVLYNVHNLATNAFAWSLQNACWALASGSRLSIDGVAAYWASKSNNETMLEWLSTVSTMQRIVASQYTGYRLNSFIDISNDLTIGTGASKTIFEQETFSSPPLFPGSSPLYTIVTNWANEDFLSVSLKNQSSSSDIFILPPRSCLAYGSEQDVIGGWVTQWRGMNLQDNTLHFVVEDRNCNFEGSKGVCLKHSLGPDTLISILPVKPSAVDVTTGSNITCSAISKNGTVIGTLSICSCNSTTELVNIQWTRLINNYLVDYVFIPAVMC
jgi:hypothetical protein